MDSDELVFRNSIPADASPSTIDWERFVANTTHRPFEAKRFFWWHNYREYGTGIPGDLFVHLFSGVHFVLDSEGPVRLMATGGTRYWSDGREIPDIMPGLADYAESARHPAFNPSLRVNFEQGTDETSLGIPVRGRERHPAHSGRRRAAGAPQPPAGARLQYRDVPGGDSAGVRARIPEALPAATRKPVVEDAVFGLRAAGPALLANASLYEQKICGWDPKAMKRTA